MADGLCSEADRKHFVAAVINGNVFSASEKSGKCVNLSLTSRVTSVSGELQRGETVKPRLNRGHPNMTATGQQQQTSQQSKKVLDAKLMKNKSAVGPAQAIVGLQAPGVSGMATTTVHAVGAGGVVIVGATTTNKTSSQSQANPLPPPSRALVESENKIVVPPQNVMNVLLPTTAVVSASSSVVGHGPKMQQKKELKSASVAAANVDMAANKKSVTEPEKQQKLKQPVSRQQDTDESSSAKKKRCSDRYDSSESSDSGVATLSCTDSSTASSDASDPGSPYSPVSLGEDANQSTTKVNMPPQMLSITSQSHRVHHSHQSHHQMTATASTLTNTNISATTHHHPSHHHQSQMQHPTTTTVQHQWPWNVSSSNNTISNHNNSSTNNNNHVTSASNKTSNSNNTSVNSVLSGNSNANTKSKRNSTSNSSDINGTAKKVRSSAATADRLQSPAGLTATASKRLKAQQEESPSQTKITGYFKSQMKPLKASLKGDLGRPVTLDAQSCLVSTNTGALDKYRNASGNKTLSKVVIFGAKDEKELNCQRSRTVAIRKDFIDLPPLTQTMPPSLKKIERKPGAKVAQVAPISRKNAVAQQLKSPKKHIAIAPRTTESSPTPLQKPPAPNAFQIDQSKLSQQTVLLTAIRIPQQTAPTPQHTVSAPGTMPAAGTPKTPMTPTKMGPMLQIPMVPNLVQFPNLLATNGSNLIMNNSQLTRMANGGQYFLNGTVLKLQQVPNGHALAPNTNGVLSVDSSNIQGNILVKSPTAISQPMSMVTPTTSQKAPTMAMQQNMPGQSSLNTNGCHQAFIAAANQRIPTQPVLMATTSGWYVLNQPTTDPISNNIPHQAALATAMVCKSPRTAVTSIANGVSPPVPPLVTLTSKLEPIPVQVQKVSNLSALKSPTPSIPTEPKDKSPSPIPLIESAKPLTVECPPLELPTEAVCPVSPEARVTLDSPKVIEDLEKPPEQSPKVSSVEDIEIQTATDSRSPAVSPKCAISPILSQPKTIRFPVPSGCEAGYRFGPKGIRRPDGVCFWDECSAKYDTNSKLLDHLQTQHVNTQTGPFSCLWGGCKVRGRESCSRRWLERHVLSHGGTKPFKCIVDGCGLRLGSQLALQKHVNSHFNATETKDNPAKRTSDPPIPKQLRKNVKKLRYRRQPFSARMFDFFDAGIMEGLQHRLMVTGSLATGAKGSVTFHGQTTARRKSPCGTSELYVKWSPSGIIPDEWIVESKSALTKTMRIQSMKYQERIALHKYLQIRNSSSDVSIKTVSKAEIFPRAVSNLSSLFNDSSVSTVTSSSCQSESSSTSSSSSSSMSSSSSWSSLLSLGERKQSRKPRKKNRTEPS